MYDCNLIKSRAQKTQDYRLPSLEPPYFKMQMPMTPMPATPETPAMPAAPIRPGTPPTPPEPERALPISPLLPRVLPASPQIDVPENPLLPPEYASVLDFESLQYMNGYLRTQIGNYVEADFLVGSTNIITKYGRLIGVGLNYILLEDLSIGDVSACDFYNIKFFRIHAHNNFRGGIVPVR